MPSLYLYRQSNEQRESLVKNLHETQNGNCFICGKSISLDLHAKTIDIDHIEPTRAGGKDGPENFGLTHDSCNRSKQSSDLRVARILASFDAIAESITEQNRSPNLGDVLVHHGGSQYNLPVKIAGNLLETTFAESGQNDVLTFQIYDDDISGFRSSFINLPIEYVHHDDYINPRAIGNNLRKLVEEFHKGLPQLVYHQPLEIRVINHRLQQSGPHAPVPPAAEAAVGVLPISVVRGQISPRSAGAQYPAHGVDKPPVVLGRSAPLALSPGQMRPQPLPNLIGHIVAPVRYRHTPTFHTLPISSNLPSYRHFDDTP